MKFSEISQEWVKEKEHFIKPTTLCVYKLSIENHFNGYFDSVDSYNKKTLQNYVLYKKNLSKRTLQDQITLLRQIFKWSFDMEYLKEFKLDDVKYPKESETIVKVKYYNNYEVEKIMKEIEEKPSNVGIAILLALRTGVRIGELSGIQYKDIDFDKKILSVNKTVSRIYDKENKSEIHIGTPKSKSSNREIPLSNKTIELLKKWKSVYPEDYYVINNKEKPNEPRILRKHANLYLKKLNIEPLNFHCFRHTFATRAIENKIDVKTVSTLLGHSDIQITLNTYVHSTDEQKRDAIELMD